ncbi:MAG: hypothetical protein CVV47_08270 [Spirochaetae bacterium HGW-Spirochaetae-3]|jgi:hypothetical protein|nr:MAG: hypothetical protein CVV47_08270 [Spirochaetae bacterium HGW-Spirochaetae-3]
MIMVKTTALLALAVIGMAATLGASIGAYVLSVSLGSKGPAETILFYGLIASALEAVLTASILAGGKRKRRELEGLSDLVRYGGSLSQKRLAGFGTIGDNIYAIVGELSDASTRKSERIAALTGLVRSAMESSEGALLAIGLDGRIIAYSREAAEQEAFAGVRIGESMLTEFFPDIALGSVLEEANRSHVAVKREGPVTFMPSYSVNGDIAHFLVSIGSKSVLESLAERLQGRRDQAEGSGKKKTVREGMLGSLFGRKTKRPIKSDAEPKL